MWINQSGFKTELNFSITSFEWASRKLPLYFANWLLIWSHAVRAFSCIDVFDPQWCKASFFVCKSYQSSCLLVSRSNALSWLLLFKVLTTLQTRQMAARAPKFFDLAGLLDMPNESCIARLVIRDTHHSAIAGTITTIVQATSEPRFPDIVKPSLHMGPINRQNSTIKLTKGSDT